jgi:hypothetical protein
MRVNDPLRLAHLDPDRVALAVARAVRARVRRDVLRLNLTLTPRPAGQTEEDQLVKSKTYHGAKLCAEWAISGRGKVEELETLLKELRADLDGIAVGEAPWRTPDLTTSAGVVAVAAGARLALAAGRTVEAVEVAVLASVDDRTIRAAAQASTLRPLGPGRPMRFAADAVKAYLYARGVPGFPAPSPTA